MVKEMMVVPGIVQLDRLELVEAVVVQVDLDQMVFQILLDTHQVDPELQIQ